MAKRKRISPIDLSNAIESLLSEYGEQVYNVVQVELVDVSNEAVKRLKGVNKFADGRNPSGKYSADWTAETVNTGILQSKRVVYNDKHYRLTHLLEKGHVTRNGTGRTFPRTPAYPHIAPVNDWAQNALVERVKGDLEKL